MTVMEMARTETYFDVKKMLYELAGKFVEASPFDRDECDSAVNYGFVMACEDHNGDQSSFVTWVYKRAKWALLDLWKKEVPIETQDPPRLDDLLDRIRRPILDRISELSQEAIFVAGLAIESPLEVLGLRKGCHPCTIRNALKRHLSGIGWTARQILSSFEEIQEVLDE